MSSGLHQLPKKLESRISSVEPTKRGLFTKLEKNITTAQSASPVEHLSIRANLSTDYDFIALSHIIKLLPNLSTLSLTLIVNKKIGEQLITLLKQASKISSFWVQFYSDPNTHDDFFISLLTLPLKKLGIYSINLTDCGAEEIDKILSSNKTLESFTFINSTINKKVGSALVNFFAHAPQLDYFYMTAMKLENDTLLGFAEALDTTSAKHLMFSETPIDNICACNFAKHLVSNRTLTRVTFYKCEIGNQGVIELCKAIRFNPVIETFDIADNNFDDEAKKEIYSTIPNMFHNNFKIQRPNLHNLMAFCISSNTFTALSSILQDYIDITLNSIEKKADVNNSESVPEKEQLEKK